MANQITITQILNVTPPFSGVACNVYGNDCLYIGSGTTFPVTFILPNQFITAPAIQITITDSSGCVVSEIFNCNTDVTPSVTPTSTPTPSITATITVTPTVTETPLTTPSVTPTNTETPTVTPTQTITPTQTLTITPTNTNTPTPTITETPTNTPTSSITPTPGSSSTPTPTITDTPTPTPTITDTPTPTTTITNTPTPTPTYTPTETPIPTPTPTITETPTSTPTPTISGVMLNNYFATQCLGSEVRVVNVDLLTGGTLTVFLGDDGNCWYPTGPSADPVTITPLLQFGLYPEGCSECFTGGCVNWEVTAGVEGASISFQPCCGETIPSPQDISPGDKLFICSTTQPTISVGFADIVNLGTCPTC